MVRRSGQMGVPVITVDGEVVVGFDEPRLERLVGAVDRTPRLGAAVAERGEGLLIGRVHPGSPAARAGLQPGDIVVRANGRSVPTTEALQESLAAEWHRGLRAELNVRRAGQELRIRVDAS